MAYKITDKCQGCQACVRPCPTQAISGKRHEIHLIDPQRCIECGTCGRVCPYEAVLTPSGAVAQVSRRWTGPSRSLIRKPACPAACASPFARSAAWRLNLIVQTPPRAAIPILPNPMPALPVGSVPISARWKRSACSPIKRVKQGTISRLDLRWAFSPFLPPLSGKLRESPKKWFVIKLNIYYNSHITTRVEYCFTQNPSIRIDKRSH
jgi:ferredoxin